MCRLTLLSNTKNSSINKTRVGNKSTLKLRSLGLSVGAMIIALCGITGELIQVFNGVLLRKNTAYTIYGQDKVVQCYTTPNQLGFETDRGPGRLKQRGEMRLWFERYVRGESSPNIIGKPWTTLPFTTYHDTGQISADSITTFCTNLHNH